MAKKKNLFFETASWTSHIENVIINAQRFLGGGKSPDFDKEQLGLQASKSGKGQTDETLFAVACYDAIPVVAKKLSIKQEEARKRVLEVVNVIDSYPPSKKKCYHFNDRTWGNSRY